MIYHTEKSSTLKVVYRAEKEPAKKSSRCIYFVARQYNPTIGRFLSVDPKADLLPSWSPYVFSSNNPIRFIDPDGNMAVPFDWIKFADGGVSFDPTVKAQAGQTVTSNGQRGISLGASAVLSNGNATLSLNADGTATNAIPLNEVSVSASSSNSTLGAVNDAFGLSNDANAGLFAGIQMLDKTGDAAEGFTTVSKALDVVGKFSGITGALVSAKEAYDNPTVGTVSKMVLDIGLVGVKSTTVGLIDGVLSVTGIKDAGFKYIDNQIDTYKYKQVLKSQMINTSTLKIK